MMNTKAMFDLAQPVRRSAVAVTFGVADMVMAGSAVAGCPTPCSMDGYGS
jgi:hypothetical protein